MICDCSVLWNCLIKRSSDCWWCFLPWLFPLSNSNAVFHHLNFPREVWNIWNVLPASARYHHHHIYKWIIKSSEIILFLLSLSRELYNYSRLYINIGRVLYNSSFNDYLAMLCYIMMIIDVTIVIVGQWHIKTRVPAGRFVVYTKQRIYADPEE
jgi:hypothetical protein